MAVLNNEWRKSTRSGDTSACVEARLFNESVQVRDSKDRQGPVLTFTYGQWDALLATVKSGALDLA